MMETSFIDRIFEIYSKLIIIDIFIMDGIAMSIVFMFIIGIWQALPLGLLVAGYIYSQALPSKPVKHFINNYLFIGEPEDLDIEFLKKTMMRFDVFGLRSPWKYYDALFV